jgi:hypothetical protein
MIIYAFKCIVKVSVSNYYPFSFFNFLLEFLHINFKMFEWGYSYIYFRIHRNKNI